MSEIYVRKFTPEDENAVIEIWERANLIVPWNDPKHDIAIKYVWQPDLFLVAEQDDIVVGTAMAGYDGHRGWVNYLASERLGVGKLLMEEVERLLKELGCPKINIQVRETNKGIVRFYKNLGYNVEPLINLGKRLK